MRNPSIHEENKLKDLKILLTLLHLRKLFQTKVFLIIFVSDKTTNMQFRKHVEGNLCVTGYEKSTTPNVATRFTKNSQAKHLLYYVFCCKLHLVIAYILILTLERFHIHLSVIAPNNATMFSTKNVQIWHTQANTQEVGGKSLTTTTKLGVTFFNEILNQSLWNTNDKNGF